MPNSGKQGDIECANYRTALDAGRAMCFQTGVLGPARVSAGR